MRGLGWELCDLAWEPSLKKWAGQTQVWDSQEFSLGRGERPCTHIGMLPRGGKE